MNRRLMASLAVLACAATTARAADDQPLTRIKSVVVTISLSNDAKKAIHGISEDELKTAAEFQIRSAGLKAACNPAPCDGILDLSLDTLELSNDTTYAYTMEIKYGSMVMYQVRPADKVKWVYGVLWETGLFGTVGKNKIGSVPADFDKLVKSFINEYYAENGR